MVMEQLVTDLCQLFNIYLLLILHFNTSINDSKSHFILLFYLAIFFLLHVKYIYTGNVALKR
jgi:hypothetical protein